ncbi:hypothetical protein M413DRAFT_430727 [Hebeloma cylindrosporum]|uniref:DUF6534 domain-containing protein n=1 Tax=Hebeloma cylindrosporum TaxID=76867 RepID=A0A0C3BFE6_HEBCY|nr:hypothetical protein M413DRAFT_430727 [Hebeloma cylindrosporum h7]
MNTTLPAIPADIALSFWVLYSTGAFSGFFPTKSCFNPLLVRFPPYLYSAAFPKDPLRTKVVVYLIYALEVTQTVLITRSTFVAFVYGFGNMKASDNVGFVWLSVPLLTGIVAFVAEGFYAYRISILARSYWVPGLVSLLAVVQLGGAIASSVLVREAGFFSHLLGRKFYITAAIWNGGSALCDVNIAIAMTYYLSKRASEGMNKTQRLLRGVITRVIEAGIVTALFAIITLVLTLLPNHATFYQVPSAVLAKIYSNSMMVLLNSRIKLSTAAYDSENMRRHFVSVGFYVTERQIITNWGKTFWLRGRELPSQKGKRTYDPFLQLPQENGNIKSEPLA